MKTPEDNITKRLLQASIRLQKIINARNQLLEVGGCEDAIEKLDTKIFHLSHITEKHVQRIYARELRIERAII